MAPAGSLDDPAPQGVIGEKFRLYFGAAREMNEQLFQGDFLQGGISFTKYSDSDSDSDSGNI